MQFNSFEFTVFLPLVFFLYWFVFQRSIRAQNGLLLAASLLFYAWWDLRFLALLLGSHTAVFFLAHQIAHAEHKAAKKMWLALGVYLGLGVLAFFKYANFFIDTFQVSFTVFGQSFDPASLRIVLPLGISFYTLQGLSYLIDVYRGHIQPVQRLPRFLTYISFFPQLLAGPMQRAQHLLPQFDAPRVFVYETARDGLRQILWGLFKKVVVANTCALFADEIFGEGYRTQPASVLFVGAFYFAIQLYADVSGYADMAVGTAKLFGFKLTHNFAYPFFSRNIAEFWRRWHISLSTWSRDYLYIPLGGSQSGKARTLLNILLVFGLASLWHGISWTFAIWGALNAVYFIPLLLTGRHRRHLAPIAEHGQLPTVKEFFQMLLTFFLAMIAWVFFRAESLPHALAYLDKMFSMTFFNAPPWGWFKFVPLAALMVVWEWVQRRQEHGLAFGSGAPTGIRWAIYLVFSAAILFCFGSAQVFIYFRF